VELEGRTAIVTGGGLAVLPRRLPLHEGTGLRQDHQHRLQHSVEGISWIPPLRLGEGRHHRIDPRLARELGGHGISVNTLCPDLIPDEEMLRRWPEQNKVAVSQRVFKRTEGPEDMIGALTFLAGPGSDFITGQSPASERGDSVPVKAARGRVG
jgi:hypothetical protein